MSTYNHLFMWREMKKKKNKNIRNFWLTKEIYVELCVKV